MKLYMAVTADKYELPLIISRRAQVIAKYAGVSASTVFAAISHDLSGKDTGIKFVRIVVEDEE